MTAIRSALPRERESGVGRQGNAKRPPASYFPTRYSPTHLSPTR
jgi:hypothetical protein